MILSVCTIPTALDLNFECFDLSDRTNSGHQRRMKVLMAVRVCVCVCVCGRGGGDACDPDNGKEIRGCYVSPNSPTLQIV